MQVTDFKEYEHIPKIWGEEIWLTNNPKYCAKLLCIKDGFQCSLHRHIEKDETFFVLEGYVLLEVVVGKFKQFVTLEPGDNYHLTPGVYHRFKTMKQGGAIVLEVSTTHSDLDVQRLEDSGPSDK